jgi:DNA-binding MarR family transcriptional regulator
MIDPLLNLPGYAMRRASGAMMELLVERFAVVGVSFTEASILMLVDLNPGVSQSALCRALDMQRANMTPLAARLEARGIIERVRRDGRSLGLSLTEDGQALTARVRAASEGHEAQIIGLIPQEHRAHFLPALHALWPGKAK